MSHTCHAKHCRTVTKPELLMCAKHWRMVPRAVQVLVYKHYQPGQCELSPAPSTKWHAAADWAIACVAQKEGFITRETLERIAKKVRPVLNERNN